VEAAASAAAAVDPAAAAREEDGDMLGFLERLPRLLDVTRVRRAISDAERHTTGEIRVSVSPFFWGSVDGAAKRAFERLGMGRTRNRNGILFFIVPSRRAFVVLGDVGIHEKVGDAIWNRLIGEMSPHFRRGDPTAAVLFGIERIATELARYFPADGAQNPNELPNFVDLAKR
jgi:uncharacterized membrane protein